MNKNISLLQKHDATPRTVCSVIKGEERHSCLWTQTIWIKSDRWKLSERDRRGVWAHRKEDGKKRSEGLFQVKPKAKQLKQEKGAVLRLTRANQRTHGLRAFAWLVVKPTYIRNIALQTHHSLLSFSHNICRFQLGEYFFKKLRGKGQKYCPFKINCLF